MKRLLLSTALVAATSAPVFAQTAEDMFRQQADPQELHASSFIGMRVYRADSVDAEAVEGIQDGWDDIGEINDVILNRDGTVEAVLVDIGGFLGIGENQVAVDMDSIRFVSDSATAEEETDFFLILNAPRGALEEAPTYGSAMSESGESASAADSADASDEEQTAAASDGSAMTDEEQTAAASDGSATTDEEQTAAASDGSGMTDNEQTAASEGSDMTEEQTAAASESSDMTDEQQAAAASESADMTEEGATTSAEASDAATAEEGEDMAADSGSATDTGTLTTLPSGESMTGDAATGGATPSREGYVTAADEQLTAEALTGAAAYDVNDQRIGEVSELLLAEDGKIESAIVDIGGFLGIGEKPVQLDLSKLDIMTSEDGTDLRVYISMAEEELEAMPEYEN